MRKVGSIRYKVREGVKETDLQTVRRISYFARNLLLVKWQIIRNLNKEVIGLISTLKF
jgi:hypothetical protein